MAPPRDAYDPGIRVEGAGPTVVLVSGMDGTGELFYRQVPLLARRYRVATYSLRDDAGSMEVLVEDLADVVERVGDGPAIVVGESFGGALALSLALAHPERVAALVVINSFARFLPQGRLWLGRHALRRLPWSAMRLVRRLTAFRLHSRHTHRREIRRFLELTQQASKEGYLDRLGILRDYDVRQRLAGIEAPTLLLASERDHLVPAVEQGRLMEERIPDATLKLLEGHGHVCLIAPNLDLEEILTGWREKNGAGAAPTTA